MKSVKLLLLTTTPNKVYEYLNRLDCVQMVVVDFKEGRANKNMEVKSVLSDFIPDIILTYRCPYILPKEWYSLAELGAYNIHPSLLPKYAGLNPWEAIFANMERVNGVTIHRMSESVDNGDIIYQQSYIIDVTDTINSAREKSDIIAVELMNVFMENMIGKIKI